MRGEPFDPKAEWFIRSRTRPHWSQSGAVVFISFRTSDSIPNEVLRRWDREKTEWLRLRGHLISGHWSSTIEGLPPSVRRQFAKTFNRCREDFTDECHGECVLRRSELATIVSDALLHFDGERYAMGDFVVMPNHVHLLASFATAEEMAAQCKSWLHFTARTINHKLGVRGHFWQTEPFDHLVRSGEQLEYLRGYIADNPRKANLRPGEYLLRRVNDT